MFVTLILADVLDFSPCGALVSLCTGRLPFLLHSIHSLIISRFLPMWAGIFGRTENHSVMSFDLTVQMIMRNVHFNIEFLVWTLLSHTGTVALMKTRWIPKWSSLFVETITIFELNVVWKLDLYLSKFQNDYVFLFI